MRPGGEDGGAQVAAKMPCTAAFMALCSKPPHSRRVTTKALGHAWKAIVGGLPALAPISLPLDKSKRLRLVEKALRSLFVETDICDALDPFTAEWMLLDAIACDDREASRRSKPYF